MTANMSEIFLTSQEKRGTLPTKNIQIPNLLNFRGEI